MEEVRWKVTDPLGNDVILKESTFREHILGDHQMADAEYRKMAELQVKNALENPQIIVEDEEDNNRHIFYKIVLIPCFESTKKRLTNLKIVVDTYRKPHQIVTWMLPSKLKDRVMKEWIVYAS